MSARYRVVLAVGTLLCAMVAFALPAGAVKVGTPGTVYMWGTTEGNPKITIKPTGILGITGTVVQVASSNSSSYVLTSKGKVWAFGEGIRGQLGDGAFANSFTTPKKVLFPAGVVIARLADPGPYDTAIAIDTNGNAWGWGDNSFGQLCLGNTTAHDEPVELPLTNVTAAAGAGDHASYVSNGAVYSCGHNDYGELGDSPAVPSSTPVPVVGLPDGVAITSLTAAWRDTGALLANGTYWNWGYNVGGQLGNGTTTNETAPVEVSLPASATQAQEGGSGGNNGQTVVVLSTGNVMAWGTDQFGQLCDQNPTAAVVNPEEISGSWASAVTGGATSYLKDSSGNLWACGQNSDGETGDRAATPDVIVPTEILTNVAQASSTAHNVVALG